MVLSSQTPRAGMSRMYMTSRRKSNTKWRWIALIGIVLVSMWLFVWSPSDETGQPNSLPASAQAGPQAATNGAISSPVDDNRPPMSVRDLPPPRDLASSAPDGAPQEPVSEVIRIDETHNAPSISTSAVQPVNLAGSTSSTSPTAGSQLSRGMSMIRDGRLVQGRRELSQLLLTGEGSLSPLDAQTIRDTLSSVNQQMIFSDTITPGDPLVESYMVRSGDYLSYIAPKYNVPYQFIELINRTPAERLQAGKAIKLVKGPFHVKISKRDFRMDIFLNDADGQPLYIRSFSVGLGKEDSTPMGLFIVQPGSKVENPSWRNPRTGEFYAKNDPQNPIGEYWLALKGADAQTQSITGYGIHGTIDPQSIGRQASMGCIRLRDKDIELVYDMLEPGNSTVEITW